MHVRDGGHNSVPVKRLLLFALCGCLSAQSGLTLLGAGGPTANSTIAYLVSTSLANPSNLADTITAPIDISGASLLIIALSNFSIGGNCNYGVSDSRSNAYTCAGTFASPGTTSHVTIWYSIPTNVGPGTTFETYGAYLSMAVAAFSGTAASAVVDAMTGSGQDTGGAIQPGSLTPASSNELLIAVGATYQSIDVSGVDSPFSSHLVQHVASVNGTNNSISLAYEIQTAAATRNPTWTISPGTNASSTILMAFKHQ